MREFLDRLKYMYYAVSTVINKALATLLDALFPSAVDLLTYDAFERGYKSAAGSMAYDFDEVEEVRMEAQAWGYEEGYSDGLHEGRIEGYDEGLADGQKLH